MFASLALGTSTIQNLLVGHDCLATLAVMRSLGAHIACEQDVWVINGRGRAGLLESSSVLDCKNSGTTMRLMAGMLSAMPFMSILDGTDQIKTRPMDRVIEPLRNMGASIYGRKDNRLAPLVIVPAKLHHHAQKLLVKSAQVKSALLLAGLFAKGAQVMGTKATRDHTETLLSFMGADIDVQDDEVRIAPLKGELTPISITVPGDLSSAAFLLVAGVLKAQGALVLKDVGVNHTRTGIIDALKTMGAHIVVGPQKMVAHEPVADIYVEKSALRGATFSGDHIVRMIDEIPVLALAATQAKGKTIIRDAHELKVKESNRITRTVESLRLLGAHIDETDDGMIIHGESPLHGANVSSFADHRIALFMSIAGLVCQSPLIIDHAEVTDDSFPGFFDALRHLGADIEEEMV